MTRSKYIFCKGTFKYQIAVFQVTVLDLKLYINNQTYKNSDTFKHSSGVLRSRQSIRRATK